MLSKNEQNERNSRITAIGGTILFHVLMLAVLFSLAFHTLLPLPAEEGVEVNFVYSSSDTGNLKPEEPKPENAIQPAVNQQETDKITATAKINETAVSKNRNAVKQVASSKTKISIVETPDESTMIHRTAKTSGSTKTSAGENKDISKKTSGQDKQNGTTPIPVKEANVEKGNGISFDLGGRGARTLIKPAFNSPEDGNIVVSVKVNAEGKVIFASAASKGTTIADPNLRKQAENAARISLFARDANAPDEQRGTITYTVIKQK